MCIRDRCSVRNGVYCDASNIMCLSIYTEIFCERSYGGIFERLKALSKGRRQNDKYRIRREIQTMKKNLAKRVIAFLCGSMMLAGLAGCSGSEKESMPANTASQGSAASQEGESTSGKLIDEPLEIELLFSGGDTIDPDGLIVQQIKEKTNVHLKLNGIPSDYATKRNTMLASNDIPDAVWCELSNIKQYAPMGMFLNLSDYEEDMPNYISSAP